MVDAVSNEEPGWSISRERRCVSPPCQGLRVKERSRRQAAGLHLLWHGLTAAISTTALFFLAVLWESALLPVRTLERKSADWVILSATWLSVPPVRVVASRRHGPSLSRCPDPVPPGGHQPARREVWPEPSSPARR